ncbi:hypothetical protein [Streptosporangium vulgare]|uniref:Uncharacterized protein n=1 Tax=Streptosporangium vulgare TaxID=46190 RepID=A0ABV5TQ90_9ACTN
MIEIDDPTVTMSNADLVLLVESYRNLTDCLLEHTVPHEGTDTAVADYRNATEPDRPAAVILDGIYEAWRREIGQQ